MTLAELRTDLVVLACAVSAGVHGALAPAHFDEGAGAGLGFAISTVLLAAAAVVLTYRPTPLAFAATAVLFTGLIAAYAAAITTGLPLLHPEREAVEGLALFTKAVEALGLALAVGRIPSFTVSKGALT